MRPNNKQCEKALKFLAHYKELSAVKRSRVDMHLRRCDSCQRAWDGLAQMEGFRQPEIEILEDQKNAIYDRLVPSVYEISQQISSTPRSGHWKPVLAGASVFALALSLVFVFLFYRQPTNHSIANFSISQPSSLPLVQMGTDMGQGRIDKMQGAIYVNGKPFSGEDGTFSVDNGTQVAVTSDSKIKFRLGRFVKVALVDETSWSVNEITTELISLKLERGKLAIEYDGSLGRRMEIHTPESVVRVKGTIFTVEVFGDGATQVSVTRGEVEVVPNDAKRTPIEVVAGNLVQVPSTGRVVSLGDRQRSLASEVEALSDNLVTTSGRIVRFDGGQEHVKVEIENQVVGITPLTVRLPSGPVSYRLSKPGMQTIEAQLANEQVSEKVSFTMRPSEDYIPQVAHMGVRKSKKTKKVASLNSAGIKDEESKNFVVRAKAAMTSGDLPYAARLLEETARRVEGDQLVTALSLLAECYAAMTNYRQAADIFDRVAALVPGTAIGQNSKYEVGRLSMDYIGDYDRARVAFTSYVASPGGGQLQEDAYFSLCELYGREGVRKNALQCFNDFLRMFSAGHRSPFAHLWRGVLHQELDQRWTMAEQDLMAFIEARPRHPRCEEARYRIALGRYNLGNYQGAMQMFHEYLDEHPGGQYSIRVERLKQTLWEKMNKKSTK